MPEKQPPEHGKFKSFKEFWPFYLSQHSDPRTRAVHIAGTTLGLTVTALAAVMISPWLIPAGIAGIYGVLFPSHFIFEKNRPATLKNPFYSVLGDFRMAGMWYAGRLENEYKKLGLDYTGKGSGTQEPQEPSPPAGDDYGYGGPAADKRAEGKPPPRLRDDFCPAAEEDSAGNDGPENDTPMPPPPGENPPPPGPGNHCR